MSLLTSTGLFHSSLAIEANVGVDVAVYISDVPSSSSMYPDNNNPRGTPPVLPRCRRSSILAPTLTPIPIPKPNQPFSGWEDIPKTNP